MELRLGREARKSKDKEYEPKQSLYYLPFYFVLSPKLL